MQALSEMHPEDDDARAFNALSVLGSLNGELEFETYERATGVGSRNVAMAVFERYQAFVLEQLGCVARRAKRRKK